MKHLHPGSMDDEWLDAPSRGHDLKLSWRAEA